MDLNFIVFPIPSAAWKPEELPIIYVPFIDRSQPDKQVIQEQNGQGETGHVLGPTEQPQNNKTSQKNNYLVPELNSNNNEHVLGNLNNKENIEIQSKDHTKDSDTNNLFNQLSTFIHSKDKGVGKNLDNKQNKYNSNQIGTQEYFQKKTISYYIPCQYQPSSTNTNKFLIFFHGNGEDIYTCRDLCQHICNRLNVNIVSVEYPGYGIFPGDPEEGTILRNALAVYEFLTIDLKIDPNDIQLFGRSIGTGSAVWLASVRDIGAMTLMSPFTSIKAVAEHKVGSIVAMMIKDRFDNQSRIENVRCPIFFIHGMKDSLVPWKHSEQLYEKVNVPTELYMPKNMDHVKFDFNRQVTDPLMNFQDKINYKLDDGKFFEMPNFLFKRPEGIKLKSDS